jgi:hypothetical protein
MKAETGHGATSANHPLQTTIRESNPPTSAKLSDRTTQKTPFKVFCFGDEQGNLENETIVPIKHMGTPSTMTVRAERLDY